MWLRLEAPGAYFTACLMESKNSFAVPEEVATPK
jgi:hypothetical protein